MKYIKDHIPMNPKKRPGIALIAQTITIHNTGNTRSSAHNERQWLTNKANMNSASWHIVIDEFEAIEAIPLNEVAWHAGRKANYTSIGVEICEFGNWNATKSHAVKLIANLLVERGWGSEHLKKHQDWTGKYCPRKLIPEWAVFLQSIEMEVQKLRKEVK